MQCAEGERWQEVRSEVGVDGEPGKDVQENARDVAVVSMAAAFSHLEEHGYVVIPNVLSADECNASINGMWQWLSVISGGVIQRSRPSTWAEPSEDTPNGMWPFCCREKGIIQWYSSCHQQFVWDIRQHPSVVAIFARLWGCDARDLLVSFDAVNIQRPIEYLDTVGITGHTTRFNNAWHHIDQSAGVRGRVCVQSFVNLNDSAEDDGCLIVDPGSHRLHEALCDKFNVSENPQQWIRLHDKERPRLPAPPSGGTLRLSRHVGQPHRAHRRYRAAQPRQQERPPFRGVRLLPPSIAGQRAGFGAQAPTAQAG
jgi:hypothetical protein